MDKLLIVDYNSEINEQLERGLSKSYRLLFADDRTTAVSIFQKHLPKVVLLDLGLPPDKSPADSGFLCLETLLKISPNTKVIVTGRSDKKHALHAVQLGAYGFYSKPVEFNELRITLQQAFEMSKLEVANCLLHFGTNISQVLPGLFGQSSAMLDVFSTVQKVAASSVPVFLIGESGTGKEMVARTIHYLSSRRAEQFQPVNCGSIPEALLDSELFGHATGAEGQVRGKLELADCGTLLLSEIEAMSSSLQVKMLRFLQEKVVQRVGGQYDIPVDVRILASKNISADKAVAEDRIRDDLFYSLGVITISLPPLRERGDDITLLAHYFLRKYAAEYNKRVRSFSTDAIHSLLDYSWPGNVSELENRVRRAVVMANGPIVEPSLLGFDIDTDEEVLSTSAVQEHLVCSLAGKTLQEARAEVERKLILSTFEREQNITRTARSLGVSRPTLYDLMKKHDILMTTTPAQPPL